MNNRNERNVLEKRGFRRIDELDSKKNTLSMKEYLSDMEMNSRMSVRNAISAEDQGYLDNGFPKLRQWVEDSLDAFKNDLSYLLFPIYVHLYLELISRKREQEARDFLEKYKPDFEKAHSSELHAVEMVKDVLHLKENTMAQAFLTNKYHLNMGKYAFDLFISFLESNNLVRILKIVNQFLDIRVFTGKVCEEVIDVGIVGATEFDFNKAAVMHGVHYVSPKVEEIIGCEEQYKYEYLDQFVSLLKKKQGENIPPLERIPVPAQSSSQIANEIEKLRDLSKRINVGKSHLPSICCYTVHNTFEGLSCAEFSPDMKLLALGYKDSYIELHSLSGESLMRLKPSILLRAAEMRTGKADDSRNEVGKTFRLVGHSGPVYAVKFFGNKRFLLSCSQDCTIRLWSLDTLSTISVYKGHFFPVWDIDIAQNDYYFASGSSDRTAAVWSVENSKPVRLFASALSDVMCVKFHPNGNYLFTGSCDFKIRMHDLQDGELVRLFVGHKDAVTALDVSSCGRNLLSAGKDKSVQLWDISTGNRIFKMAGHDRFVYSVSFAYFAPLLVSSAGDNTVKVWDRNTGQLLGTYHTKSTPVLKAVFGYRNVISVAGPYTPNQSQ
jgi:transcription initiation factor TFIID subunit 5